MPSSATMESISARWTSSAQSTGSTPDRCVASLSWSPGFAEQSRACCLAPTQQVTGGTVICGSIAEGIGNDKGARDGRQHFGRVAWREPFRNQLVQAHLEKALHFPRNFRRQILRGGAERRARAHTSFGQRSASECVRPHSDGVRVLLQFVVNEF